VVSALNDIFRGRGVNNQSFDATQFTKFMKELNRSPTTKKLLYDNFPEGAPAALDNLFTVSEGISKAFGERITTGRLGALFDENSGMLRKLMSGGVAIAASKIAGPLGGMGVAELMKQSTDVAKTTGKLLASPAFQKTIRQAVTDGVVDGKAISKKTEAMEKSLAKSKQYKEWADTLSESDKAKLASMGLTHYLLTQDEEQQPTN